MIHRTHFFLEKQSGSAEQGGNESSEYGGGLYGALGEGGQAPFPEPPCSMGITTLGGLSGWVLGSDLSSLYRRYIKT